MSQNANEEVAAAVEELKAATLPPQYRAAISKLVCAPTLWPSPPSGTACFRLVQHLLCTCRAPRGTHAGISPSHHTCHARFHTLCSAFVARLLGANNYYVSLSYPPALPSTLPAPKRVPRTGVRPRPSRSPWSTVSVSCMGARASCTVPHRSTG